MSLATESASNNETSVINEKKSNKSNESKPNESSSISRLETETTLKTIKLERSDEKMEIDQQESSQSGDKQINSRVILSDEQLDKLIKEDFVKKWKQQNIYIDSLEEKLKIELSNKEAFQENEEKIKQQLFDLTRKENLLVMKLTTKEHEIQDYLKQIQELRLTQIALNDQLQSTFIDPAVNMIFEEMKKEVEKSKLKVEEMQSELSAWKFTPDSNTGKRLMAKCRLLYQENEELGKVISSGRVAKLEGEVALLKSFSEEMKKSQGEIDEFLFELDEDVEGMQSTIYHLQQQLKEANLNLQKYQTQEENQIKNDIVEIDKSTNNNLTAEDQQAKTDESNSLPSPNKEPNNCDLTENVDNKTSNQTVLINEDQSTEKTNSTQNNRDNLTNESNQTIDEEKNNLERKRSLDEALEEVNASGGLMKTDCGIDSIIKKHRKLEQEKS